MLTEIYSISIEKQKARKLRKTVWWKRKREKGICYYCQKKIPLRLLTMDHIIPLARGGKSIKINIVACCKECNSVKKNQLPTDGEWMEHMDKKI